MSIIKILNNDEIKKLLWFNDKLHNDELFFDNHQLVKKEVEQLISYIDKAKIMAVLIRYAELQKK